MVKTEYAKFYLNGLLEVFLIFLIVASKRRKTKTTFRNLAAVELYFFVTQHLSEKGDIVYSCSPITHH
jgi:hypothetical protein